jgi:transcriptional antiterminator NusG
MNQVVGKWYIVQCKTNCENKVASDISELIKTKSLESLIFELHVPEEEVSSLVNGKNRTIKKRIYPGYVLIKMIANEKTIGLVGNQKHVTGFAGVSKFTPSPISEKEAQDMLGKKNSAVALVGVKPGDSVSIDNGPFAGFKGIVSDINKDKVTVQLSIFGRSTNVDLQLSDLKK